MVLFHLKEIYFRLIYFFISVFFTFFIFYNNKEILLNFLAPLNLYYNNILEIFFIYVIFIFLIAIIWNLPFFYYHILLFFKVSLFNKEYFYFKKHIKFNILFLFFYFITILSIILNSLIQFSFTFNTEQLNMQISFISFINIFIYLIFFLFINTIINIIFFYKKINRLYIYSLILFIFCLITTLDLFNLIFVFILYVLLTEIVLLCSYIYLNRGL